MSVWTIVVRRTAFDLRVDGLIGSMAFDFLRMWMVFVRAAIFVAIVIIVITVHLNVGRFRFLFVTFRWWPLLFVVATAITDCFVLPLKSLSLGRVVPIERSRFAVCAGVVELVSRCIVNATGVIALDMLPCIACLAINGVSIVIGIVTNAFDRVGLLIYRFIDERIGGRNRSRST